MVAVVVLLTDSVVGLVVGFGFIVTKPCLVRLVVVPPFPFFLSSDSTVELSAEGLVLAV